MLFVSPKIHPFLITALTICMVQFCLAEAPSKTATSKKDSDKKYDFKPDLHPTPRNDDPFRVDILKIKDTPEEKYNIQLQFSFSQINPLGNIPIRANDSYDLEKAIASMNTYSFQGTRWEHLDTQDENLLGLLIGFSLAKKNLTITTANGYYLNNVELQWLSTRFGGTYLRKISPEHVWFGLDTFLTVDSWQQSSLNTNEKWSTWIYNLGVSGHLDFTVTNNFLCFVGLDQYWKIQGNTIQLPASRPRVGLEWEF